MSDTPNRSWFAELRRDRGLFALLGALVLLLNIVQPLTAAAAGNDGHWVICTAGGAGKSLQVDGLPGAMPDDCPICISGNHCTSPAPAYKAALATEPAFAAPVSFALPALPFEAPTLPASGLAESPSAARAPPPSA